MKKLMLFLIAVGLLSIVLAMPGFADSTWTYDTGSSAWWFQDLVYGQNDGLQSNFNWSRPTPKPSELWISRAKTGDLWTWTYYVHDFIDNSTHTASLLDFNAGLAISDAERYKNVYNAQILSGGIWTDISPSVNGTIGDEMITWSAAQNQIKTGAYVKFSFTTDLQGWVNGIDFDISDSAVGTGGKVVGWESTVAPSTVPEPGTIIAALSVLAPAGFVFRRRRA